MHMTSSFCISSDRINGVWLQYQLPLKENRASLSALDRKALQTGNVSEIQLHHFLLSCKAASGNQATLWGHITECRLG